MSTHRRWASLREVKTQLFRRRASLLQMDGRNLTAADSYRVFDSYYLMMVMIRDFVEALESELPDSEWQALSRNYSASALARKLEAFCKLDVAFVAKQFKNATQFLRHISDKDMPKLGQHYLSMRKFNKCIAEMARSWEVATDQEVWKLIQPFFSLFIRNDSTQNFIRLNDLLQFNCRLTLKDVDWIEDENIQAYVDFEEKLHEQVYDDQLLSELSDIVENWFRDFSFDNPWADHGYGATSEVQRSKGTAAKYHAMIPTTGAVTLSQRLQWLPSETVWPGIRQSYEEYEERMYLNQIAGKPVCDGLVQPSDLTCKVQLVPKGVDKKRVVSMEPTVHQFYQKQIGDLFDVHFKKHPEMHIDLHDQSKNCRLTVEGSRTRKYGTIDLSSASDSVTLTVVKRAFQKVPRLLDSLLLCRTTKAELPDGRVVALEKMSPMGSAVCFPVECTIFSAVVALANRHCGVDTYYRVYGDDMVVDIDVWDETIHLLKELHFIVNEDKSFHPDLPFKESCGIECYRGNDVSPMRLSRKWDSKQAVDDVIFKRNYDALLAHKAALIKSRAELRKTAKHAVDPKLRKKCRYLLYRAIPKQLASLQRKLDNNHISQQLDSMYKLANDAYDRGYLNLRQLIISRAREYYSLPVFSLNGKAGFLTFNPNISDNYETRVRYGELEVKVLMTRSTIDEGEDIARYSKLLEEYNRSSRTALSSPYDEIDVQAGCAHTIVKYVWVPLSSLLDATVLTRDDEERIYADALKRLIGETPLNRIIR